MSLYRCPQLETLTTREGDAALDAATRRGKMSEVKRKCAKWFPPNCSSKPSSVLPQGQDMTAALLISTWEWVSGSHFSKTIHGSALARITYVDVLGVGIDLGSSFSNRGKRVEVDDKGAEVGVGRFGFDFRDGLIESTSTLLSQRRVSSQQ